MIRSFASVVRYPGLFVGKARSDHPLPLVAVPGTQPSVRVVVFLGNWMRADYDLDRVLLPQEFDKIRKPGARGVAHHQAGGQVNCFYAVADHLGGGVLDVTAGAPPPSGT